MKIEDTSRIVIKIGSSLLFDEETNKLNFDWLVSLAEDVKYLKNFEWYEVKQGVHKVIRAEDDYLLLLGEGRLVNLALATGHPSRVMDGSFCNQVLAQIALFKEAFASNLTKDKEVYVKVLPKKLDEEVAALMVSGFGGVITKLTKEQTEYIKVNQSGPFKSKNYTY